MTDIVIDCTELHGNPVRTGIQRVVRNLLRHWPADGPTLHLARFHGGELVRVPDRARRILTDEEPGVAERTPAEVAHLLATTGSAEALPAAAAFIPEIFYDLARAECHIARARLPGRKLAMLAYDFLPFLQPHLFHIRSAAALTGYLMAIRAAHAVAHISEQTRHAYQTRVMHGRGVAGPVLPLGADGLAVERQAWAPQRDGFVCLGSLDGRKNQHLVVGAFRRLWEAGYTAPLVLIGGGLPHVDTGWLQAALACPQFRWLDAATDADIARELRRARATIYASPAEGFGLPPIESLAAGIPVIASAAIPSLEMLPPGGQCRLAEITETAIADAVLALADDNAAASLWAEAARHALPGWSDFGRQVADWLREL